MTQVARAIGKSETQIFRPSALPWALMPVRFSFETEFKDSTPLGQASAIGGIRPG